MFVCPPPTGAGEPLANSLPILAESWKPLASKCRISGGPAREGVRTPGQTLLPSQSELYPNITEQA